MLFFYHLLSGIVVGVLLFFVFSDERVIILTAIGSILPDLIDKPLGHIILADSIGGGRIFFHGFWFMILLLILGILIFVRFQSPLLLALSVGVVIHQFADRMWTSPVDWFWPFLGPYSGGYDLEEYFFEMLFREITTFEEIFCFLVIIFGFVMYYRLKKRSMAGNGDYYNSDSLRCLGIFLAIIGFVYLLVQSIIVLYGIYPEIPMNYYSGWFEIILFGGTVIIGGLALIYALEKERFSFN